MVSAAGRAAATAAGGTSARAAAPGALWGFGLWWLAVAIALTIRYAREPLPFAMSWWAFTFPLGAYTVATCLLGDVYGLPIVTAFGFAFWLLLTAFWVVVAVRTVGGTYTGELLKAPAPVAAQ